MRQLSDIAAERNAVATVAELTGAFEGIASMHISKIKDQVLSSQAFFNDLWHIYSQIRVDQEFHFGRRSGNQLDKELLILVTAEGSFSGDIDQRVINAAALKYDAAKQDLLVVGHHGTAQLRQLGIVPIKSFKLPREESNINPDPLVAIVQQYKTTSVYYPTYVSLATQEVKKLAMSAAVAERGQSAAASDEFISEGSYIFEPSAHAVIDHLETSMIGIMLSEIILESKLAQYASRFQAMHSAKSKADESLDTLKLTYNRAHRRLKDERIKEIINGLRKGRG